MSDEIVIRVERLRKAYRIGVAESRPETLAAALGQALAAPLRNFRNLRRLDTAGVQGDGSGTLLALDDVSFEVGAGDVVGIIGRNGAGKSTLLKLLSRITEPTAGRIAMRGRVSSLLEVGTGFHPELTGRENVYLNGTILGMTKREIDAKFDQIVEFSGVEAFLDTPVKRYSSGMRVRLAFAVAAHLDPDILIIDEVLAVGDAEFQRKCMGKMEDVARGGRTVLFVSHNMGAVQSLCRRGILLVGGRVAFDGSSEDAVRGYLDAIESHSRVAPGERTDRGGRGPARLLDVGWSRGEGSDGANLMTGAPAHFLFTLSEPLGTRIFQYTIYDARGSAVVGFSTAQSSDRDRLEGGSGASIRCELDTLLLRPGRYRLNTAIRSGSDFEDHVEGAATLDVSGGSVEGRPTPESSASGPVTMPHRWATRSAALDIPGSAGPFPDSTRVGTPEANSRGR